MFYGNEEQTIQLANLRKQVKSMLLEILMLKKKYIPLIHLRLVAQGKTKLQCVDCKRLFSSKTTFHYHKHFCGRDEALYGFIKTRRCDHICIICGLEFQSKISKSGLTLIEHIRAHKVEDLEKFGLSSRK